MLHACNSSSTAARAFSVRAPNKSSWYTITLVAAIPEVTTCSNQVEASEGSLPVKFDHIIAGREVQFNFRWRTAADPAGLRSPPDEGKG